MAGFIPNGGYQRTLEVSAKALQTLFSVFLPDMSDVPGAENPMDHINRIITPDHLYEEYSFIFDLDQTYLPPLISSLKYIINSYPLKGEIESR
ncbi:MAG: hypothetical protein KFB95_06985 [Simkaniaceae bacterium]|nr:MAG: hypothetical protein KFB95_06985 [Simkaniaceae bacterium]